MGRPVRPGLDSPVRIPERRAPGDRRRGVPGLYAPFLGSVGEAVGLEGFGDRMHDVAEGWTSVGRTLREASETGSVADLRPYLESAAEAVADLAGTEAALYEDALAALDRT